MNKERILLLGDINIDTIFPVAEFPIPGRDGIAQDIAVEVGGAVVNSAILLNNLGSATSLIGCVGEDIWAEFILRKLNQTHINLDHIQATSHATTGLTFVITIPDGERTMFSYRGANTLLQKEFFADNLFKDATLLHISGYAFLQSPQKEAALHAIALAHKQHVKICIDTGLEPVMQRTKEMQDILPLLSICITGPQEVQALLGCDTPEQAAQELISQGVELVAIKQGSEGCFLANKTQSCLFPAFSIHAVDTTGAGDSFSAGLLFAYQQKMSLQASAILSSALGAMAAMVSGAGFSLPDTNKVCTFLQNERQKSYLQFYEQYFDEVIKKLNI